MILLENLNIEYQSAGYLIFSIEYQYGEDSKFILRNEITEKFEYQIFIWLIFNI